MDDYEENYKRYFPNGQSNLFHWPDEQQSAGTVASSSDSKNTTASRKNLFGVEESDIHQNPKRRSPRLNKLKNPYGLPPVGPEFKKLLIKGTRTGKKSMEGIENVQTLSGPYDGFGFTDKEITALEVSNVRRITLRDHPPKLTSSECQLVEEYTSQGLDREAVELGVLVYLSKQNLIREFVDGFIALREMGYSKCEAGEALVTCERDLDRALAHLKKGLVRCAMNSNITYQSTEATAK